MDKGYIKLWRKTKEWVFFRDAIALQLWILLLLDATHKPMKKIFKGQEIELMPGQVLTGRKYLFAQTGIPETTIERWLKRFEKCGQIGQQTDTRNRLITIVDWETYQGKVDNKRTANGQQTDTNKNGRMEELKKKEVIQPSATASGVVTASERHIQPHQTVVEDMKKLYEEKTGQPFAYKKEYFILTAALIKQHGIDAVNEKCRILAICCDRGEAWFAKDGWASFNPKKLSAHWNEIIPQKKYLSKEERDAIESQEIRKKLKEQDDECAAIVAEAKRQRKAQAGAPVQVTG